MYLTTQNELDRNPIRIVSEYPSQFASFDIRLIKESGGKILEFRRGTGFVRCGGISATIGLMLHFPNSTAIVRNEVD